MDTRHINPFQLARRWGINPRTLQNWRCKGRGPSYLKIGGHIMYSQDEIDAFEAKHRVKTENKPQPYQQESRA